MNTINPYEDDRSLQWVPQQPQRYDGRYVSQYQQVPPGSAERSAEQKTRAPQKMSKARALELARTFKRWLVVASLVGFGTVSGLAALHQVGSTATATTHTSSSSQKSSSSSNNSSSNSSSSFLNQSGSSN